LKDKTELKFHCIYPFNNNKFEIFREYIEKNLKKGYIKSSQLSTRYSILFIFKKDDKFRLYIDYCQFNIIIKKNYYPLLFIVEFKDRLIGVQWFITLDLLKVYNLFRIKKEYK